MIILRDKSFGVVSPLTNLGKAFGSASKGLSAGTRFKEATKGVGKIGGLALGAGGLYAGAKTVGTTKDALEGNMGKENGFGY